MKIKSTRKQIWMRFWIWAEHTSAPCRPPEKRAGNSENQYTKWFDYDKINVGLSIRYRKNGDYLTLSGGGKKEAPQVYDR